MTATERANRVYHRRRVFQSNDPSSGQYFDVPVIRMMTCSTMQMQARTVQIYFDNRSGASTRVTHVKRVTAKADEAEYVDVERPDVVLTMDVTSGAAGMHLYLANKDPPPIQLDGSNSPAHQKVHYVRYFKDNDTGSDCYGDMELIDIMRLTDANGIEWQYYMRHPELGAEITDSSVPYSVTVGYCDPSLPLEEEI